MLAVPTTCPFCACGCGFYLLSSKGQIAGVAPSETHPVSHGNLCARGWSAHEAGLWGDRLRQPVLRRNGKAETVPWSEALGYVAARLRELLDAGKPVGVLGSPRATNEENYLAGKLARAGLQTNNVDFSYRFFCQPLFAGLEQVLGKGASLITLDDVQSSQLILLVEGNLAETHPRAASSVMKAMESGARLITFGSKKTQMARLASLYLSVTPGNEGEVIDGLLAAALDLNLHEGISAAARADGYETLRRNLEAARRTEELRQAAEWITGAERAAFLMSLTSGEDDRIKNSAAAFVTLAAITGHLGRPGSGLLPLLPRSNVRGACDMGVVPDRLPGYDSLDDGGARQRAQDLWKKKLPTVRGWSAEAQLQNVCGLVIAADDPPSVLPMGQQAKATMERIEFLVVLDAFDTPTTRMAHAVLPIANFAETDGTVTNMEGRVQSFRAAINPPGEARVGWQVLADLCARLGAGGLYGTATDVLREIGEVAPRYAALEQRLSEDQWNGALLETSDRAKFVVRSAGAAGRPGRTSTERPYLLVREGTFDWGSDPLVAFSPTLSRDYRSERKHFPNGFVEISQRDADDLNVTGGRQVRLSSVHGDAVIPVRVRTDLTPRMLSVPFAFRDQVFNVLGTDGLVAVRIGPA